MRSSRAMKSVERSLELFNNEPFELAHKSYGSQASVAERGAIFTRIEVVNFILDLVEYTIDRPLYRFRLLEPSVGDGDFLFPVVDRVLGSIKAASLDGLLSDISNSIRAVEIHKQSVLTTREKLIAYLLQDARFDEETATMLASKWVVHNDFLLYQPEHKFNFVVGNPPYVRQELIPEELMKAYRRKFETIYDRADLYVPFIEHSLNLLDTEGHLGFICADRWMKNKYGGPLRHFVSNRFHLKYYIDMTDTDAFHAEVIAYPAITVFANSGSGKTRVAHRPKIDRHELTALAQRLVHASEHEDVRINKSTSAPWILDVDKGLELLRRLEEKFPLIENTGCKIGIGVATGADKVFIKPFETLDIEPDRKLPLATTKDIESGKVIWKGLGVVNPYQDDGSLVRLEEFPKLNTYLTEHRELITKRHVARSNPTGWYKTIDRIYAPLTKTEKLFIPDIKGAANIVYDKGELYPHHNLYYITSKTWDLRILQAFLLSGIATFFVSKYSPQMRGGYLRFQAQYLRRIRIPDNQRVTDSQKTQLRDAMATGDRREVTNLIFDFYDLSEEDRNQIIKS